MTKTKLKKNKSNSAEKVTEALPQQQVPKWRVLLISSLLLAALLLFFYTMFLAYFHDLIYPGVKIAGQNMGGLTVDQAKEQLNLAFSNRTNQLIVFEYQTGEQHPASASLSMKTGSPSVDINYKADQAFKTGRTGNYLQDFTEQLLAIEGQVELPLILSFADKQQLTAQLEKISQAVEVDPVDAQISITETVAITPSQTGKQLDQAAFFNQLENYLTFKAEKSSSLPLKTAEPQLNTAQAEQYRQLLIQVKEKPLSLTYDVLSWTIDQATLYSLLDMTVSSPLKPLPQSTDQRQLSSPEIQTDQTTPLLDKDKLAVFLTNISLKISRPAKDARFTFDRQNNKVSEFQAAQQGKELDTKQTATLITESLLKNDHREIVLPVKITEPKITTADVNNLGIRDLLGEGFSNFSGSIDNRIFNVGLAASRINGVLVAPGETFSFNQALGEVTGVTGYKPAYVIKSGRTVLDDGGGVCQVSTTLFRALLNAGLPITDRTAHAYRVGYYEQGFPPGLDATVFAPSVDLKFTNDTPSYILIQAFTRGTTLTFDLYGTADGREAVLSKPVITSQTPPPPELRQDDPTLPKGTVKQVDWAAWGANVSFTRTVTRDGQTIINETWKSNFRPWQAVYLVGTKE